MPVFLLCAGKILSLKTFENLILYYKESLIKLCKLEVSNKIPDASDFWDNPYRTRTS
jgi:hypothetical protein